MDLQILYTDAEKNTTKRVLTLSSFGPDGIRGLCHLRGEIRTFRYDRIKECIDLETGEVLKGYELNWMLVNNEKERLYED